MKLDLTFPVTAVSVAGVETCIAFPDFAFDIGRCPEFAVHIPTILITHGHMDHIGALAYHAARRAGRGLPAPTYFVPVVIWQDVLGMLDAMGKLDRGAMRANVIPCTVGERYPLKGGLVAVPIEMVHRVPCYGYKVYHKRTKLKLEFQGHTNEEIIALRKRGVGVSEEVEVLRVAFTGDTTVEGLDRNPELYTADLLVMEVSFVDDTLNAKEARSRGHMHLDDVVERAHLFQNKELLFTHFSARHSPKGIQEALRTRLPADLYARVRTLVE